jgi:uncharacterized membrane protein
MKKWIQEEHHLRSIVKAFTWRLTGTLDTMVISFIITGQAKWAISIGLVEFFTKTLLYYLHERIWNKIDIGKKSKEISYHISPSGRTGSMQAADNAVVSEGSGSDD